MDLKALRRIPEERVTAVFGLPAIVAGLGAGLDRSTFANFKEAREAAYESNIIPTQRLLGAELKTQLLADFVGETDTWDLEFDLARVRVLQEDEDAKHTRARGDFAAGVHHAESGVGPHWRAGRPGGRLLPAALQRGRAAVWRHARTARRAGTVHTGGAAR